MLETVILRASQTNYDHWESPPSSDDRRTPGDKHMLAMGQGNHFLLRPVHPPVLRGFTLGSCSVPLRLAGSFVCPLACFGCTLTYTPHPLLAHPLPHGGIAV